MGQADTEKEDYGMFKVHLDDHTKLRRLIEKELEESGEELKSSELADRIAADTKYSSNHVHALITQGREWITEDSDVVTDQRPEQSGGTPTIFWRHDS